MNDMEIACLFSVARTGSFTVSARELTSTQQAVSRNIQNLEEEIGYPLLNRGGSAVTLTWAGRRFIQWRLEHDAQLAALERQSRRLSPAGRDELFVAWNDWTGCPAGMERDIRDFRESYPSVVLHTRQGSTEEVAAMLTDGAADIAVLPENSTHSLIGVIVSAPFETQRLYAVTRDDAGCGTVEELASLRHLASPMGDKDVEATRRRIGMFCAELGVTPKHLEILPNVRSMYAELLCGGCYTIAPAADALAGMTMIPLPVSGMRLVFVTRQGGISPWASLFESYIRQRRRGA